MDLFEEKRVSPMLISQMQEPFNDDKWIYELKLDGAGASGILTKVPPACGIKGTWNCSPNSLN